MLIGNSLPIILVDYRSIGNFRFGDDTPATIIAIATSKLRYE
jgi:K+/H+ antiporter YhaU regulatory subunit KhtT